MSLKKDIKMNCENVRCPYYRKVEKRDWVEKSIGVQRKQGGCKFSYCKLK